MTLSSDSSVHADSDEESVLELDLTNDDTMISDSDDSSLTMDLFQVYFTYFVC